MWTLRKQKYENSLENVCFMQEYYVHLDLSSWVFHFKLNMLKRSLVLYNGLMLDHFYPLDDRGRPTWYCHSDIHPSVRHAFTFSTVAINYSLWSLYFILHRDGHQ